MVPLKGQVLFVQASEAGCRLLLSANLREGHDVTATNPCAAFRHALLAALLGSDTAA
jgi:hypothetical protein